MKVTDVMLCGDEAGMMMMVCREGNDGPSQERRAQASEKREREERAGQQPALAGQAQYLRRLADDSLPYGLASLATAYCGLLMPEARRRVLRTMALRAKGERERDKARQVDRDALFRLKLVDGAAFELRRRASASRKGTSEM